MKQETAFYNPTELLTTKNHTSGNIMVPFPTLTKYFEEYPKSRISRIYPKSQFKKMSNPVKINFLTQMKVNKYEHSLRFKYKLLISSIVQQKCQNLEIKQTATVKMTFCFTYQEENNTSNTTKPVIKNTLKYFFVCLKK